MANRRRKDLKKRPTTRKGRQPKTNPTQEWQDQFESITGRKWQGHLDSAANSPLAIMEARKLLGGNASAMISAGQGFKQLYINRNGPVNAKSGSIGQMSGNGSIGMLREVIDINDVERDEAFKKLNARLLIKGKSVQQTVVNVAVYEIIPIWLQQIIDGIDVDIDCKERDDLIVGLKILIS